MKKNTSIIPLCLFLLIFTSLKAQDIDWSFHADLGVSRIPVLTKYHANKDIFYPNDVRFFNHPSSSLSLGVNTDMKIRNSTFFSSGLSLVHMSGIRQQIGRALGGVEYGNLHTNYKVRYVDQSFNLAIPIALKFKFKKVDFKAGFQLMYLLKGKINTQISSKSIYDSNYTLRENSNEKIRFKKLDYGLTTGVYYKFNNLFSFDVNLYWGLENILEDRKKPMDEDIEHVRRNRRLSFGLSYYLKDKSSK